MGCCNYLWGPLVNKDFKMDKSGITPLTKLLMGVRKRCDAIYGRPLGRQMGNKSLPGLWVSWHILAFVWDFCLDEQSVPGTWWGSLRLGRPFALSRKQEKKYKAFYLGKRANYIYSVYTAEKWALYKMKNGSDSQLYSPCNGRNGWGVHHHYEQLLVDGKQYSILPFLSAYFHSTTGRLPTAVNKSNRISLATRTESPTEVEASVWPWL